MVAEDDTAFSQEASESLVSKANLSGRGFEGPASSVGGFRSLKKVFGCPAVSAVVGVSGGVVRAVEHESTGVRAPSESPAGQVSTSLSRNVHKTETEDHPDTLFVWVVLCFCL